MKERPIIFSAESVRAILAGRKTQTRRVVKPQPEDFAPGQVRVVVNGEAHTGPADYLLNTVLPEFAAPWRPGDRLWVKETWSGTQTTEVFPNRGRPITFVVHRATYDPKKRRESPISKRWQNPVSMPRWASRLTLEVVSVRVERLHDITETDATAEGAEPDFWRSNHSHGMNSGSDHIGPFSRQWDALNAKRGYPWDANPWVWVVEFKKVEEAP